MSKSEFNDHSTSLRVAIGIAIFSVIFVCIFLFHWIPPLEGKVIDSQTGKPVKGAVLLLGWQGFGIDGGGAFVHGRREVVADGEGNFSLGPGIYFTVGFSDLMAAAVGVAAPGYVTNTHLLAMPDPYVSIAPRAWVGYTLKITMESHSFNKLSLERLAQQKPERHITPPKYLQSGEYHTQMRADGNWYIESPIFRFALTPADGAMKFPEFWQRIHSAAPSSPILGP